MNKNRIYEFDFLRILAALMVFINHIWAFLPFKIPDLGGRGVEIFFILSGFLMFYNYSNRQLSISFFDSIKFGIKKIFPYWFLHIITMLFMLVLHVQNDGIIWLKQNLFGLVCNIFLVQTFIPVSDVYFGFNGVSWFLSSILFSYILFPLLLTIVKKIANTEKYLLLMIITYLGLMFLQTAYKGYGLYTKNYVFYVFPLYGLSLFFMGILLSAIFIGRCKLSYTANNKLKSLITIILYGRGGVFDKRYFF